jgi:hypothetical protein
MTQNRTMASSFAEEWYAAPGETLSQGDIVASVPWGRIDSPLTVCQPANAEPKGKASYYPIDQLPRSRSVQYVHAKFKISIGLVLWPDCQIDKAKNQGRPESDWLAAIAPVIPLSSVPAHLHSKVFQFERAQWFPLPSRPPEVAEDCYADLRYIWTVSTSLLADRKLTLTTAGRQALSAHRFWFDTEVRLRPEIDCPHCSKAIDSSVWFKQKDANAED